MGSVLSFELGMGSRDREAHSSTGCNDHMYCLGLVEHGRLWVDIRGLSILLGECEVEGRETWVGRARRTTVVMICAGGLTTAAALRVPVVGDRPHGRN
jgi:hypothetical protein